MAKPASHQRSALRLETLEAREVPATGVLSGTTLTIEGTDGGDTVVARVSGGQVTFSGVTIRDGRRYSDTVPLSALRSVAVRGRGGNDVVNLSALNIPTQVWGGNGNDQLIGGSNRDTFYGDWGSDYLRGNAGNDWLVGGEGSDAVYGGQGDDWISGDPGNDRLNGDSGNDRVSGGEGRDTLNGGNGTDRLDGHGYGAGRANTAANFDVFYDDFAYGKPLGNSDTAAPVRKGEFNQTGLLAVFSALNATDVRNAVRAVGGRQFEVKLVGDNKTVKVRFDGSWSDNDPSPVGTSTAEFWPILLFRARMQSFGVNPTVYRTDAEWTKLNMDSRGKLFDPADALRQFTGRTVRSTSAHQLDFGSMRSLLSQGKVAVAVAYTDFMKPTNSAGIMSGVNYAVRQVFQSADGRKWVQLYNPLGTDTASGKRVDNNPYLPRGDDGLITVTWDEFRKSSNFAKVVTA